ncbi:hypothetical protein HK405_001481, partial [Cladochytrium tenue]
LAMAYNPGPTYTATDQPFPYNGTWRSARLGIYGVAIVGTSETNFTESAFFSLASYCAARARLYSAAGDAAEARNAALACSGALVVASYALCAGAILSVGAWGLLFAVTTGWVGRRRRRRRRLSSNRRRPPLQSRLACALPHPRTVFWASFILRAVSIATIGSSTAIIYVLLFDTDAVLGSITLYAFPGTSFSLLAAAASADLASTVVLYLLYRYWRRGRATIFRDVLSSPSSKPATVFPPRHAAIRPVASAAGASAGSRIAPAQGPGRRTPAGPTATAAAVVGKPPPQKKLPTAAHAPFGVVWFDDNDYDDDGDGHDPAVGPTIDPPWRDPGAASAATATAAAATDAESWASAGTAGP